MAWVARQEQNTEATLSRTVSSRSASSVASSGSSWGLETTWAPSKERGGWGWWGFYLRWIFQTLGWVITALGAAVLTGLLGRKD